MPRPAHSKWWLEEPATQIIYPPGDLDLLTLELVCNVTSDVKFHDFFALKYFMKYFWNISKISRCCWTTDNMTKIHPIQTNKSADIGAYRSCSFQQILLQCTSKESINGIFQYIISTNVHRQQTLAWRTDVISHNIYWNILPDEGLCRLYGRYLPGGRGICPGHWMSIVEVWH